MTRPRLRPLAILSMSAAVALLTACAAGQNAQTYQERAAGDHVNGRAEALLVNAVAVQLDSYQRVQPGENARAFAAISNNGPEVERLVSVTSDAAETVEIVAPAGEEGVEIAPGDQVLLTPGGPGRGFLRLSGLTRSLAPGETVELVFTFENSPSVTLMAPVRLPDTALPRAESTVEAEGGAHGGGGAEDHDSEGGQVGSGGAGGGESTGSEPEEGTD